MRWLLILLVLVAIPAASACLLPEKCVLPGECLTFTHEAYDGYAVLTVELREAIEPQIDGCSLLHVTETNYTFNCTGGNYSYHWTPLPAFTNPCFNNYWSWRTSATDGMILLQFVEPPFEAVTWPKEHFGKLCLLGVLLIVFARWLWKR